jgi:nucleoside-diphosphate-sugar epimerase
MSRILVTGAVGQIGSELTMTLRDKYGADNVVAAGNRTKPSDKLRDSGPFEFVDCTKIEKVLECIKKYDIGTVYHLGAILSAVAEAKPQLAWDVNINGLYNVLEVARETNCAVFTPSSIGAFGPTTPLDNTPQDTIQRPNTMYGVTKVAGELLCDYYATRFAVDARGLRLPGLISYVALPGGGTTDYAVEIFYQAVRYRHYTCFLRADTRLDMMYMPDALAGMMQLMEVDRGRLVHRNAFNVTAMSITPEDLAAEIRKHMPDFAIDYEVDPVRQAIADSWPRSIDDGAARSEWGWAPRYDLAALTADMLDKVTEKLARAASAATEEP